MPRIIQSIHLSDYQARVMLLAHEAQTPELAFAELGNQDPRIESNLLGARDTLAKIGLIEITDNAITVTPEGEKVMQDEYLIDETGMVTEKGEEILQAQSDEKEMPGEKGPESDPLEDPMQQGADMAPATAGGEMETTPGGEMGESSIFKMINDLTKLNG